MRKYFLYISFLILFANFSYANSYLNDSKLQLLNAMFQNMVVKKDSSLIPQYYSKDFILYSNGKTMNYSQFAQFHENVYKTNIQYKVNFDKQTIVEHGNKVALKMTITTQVPPSPPQDITVIAIVEFKGNKIYRVWELTYPDWSQMKDLSTGS